MAMAMAKAIGEKSRIKLAATAIGMVPHQVNSKSKYAFCFFYVDVTVALRSRCIFTRVKSMYCLLSVSKSSIVIVGGTLYLSESWHAPSHMLLAAICCVKRTCRYTPVRIHRMIPGRNPRVADPSRPSRRFLLGRRSVLLN